MLIGWSAFKEIFLRSGLLRAPHTKLLSISRRDGCGRWRSIVLAILWEVALKHRTDLRYEASFAERTEKLMNNSSTHIHLA